jgi:hypothetical protein
MVHPAPDCGSVKLDRRREAPCRRLAGGRGCGGTRAQGAALRRGPTASSAARVGTRGFRGAGAVAKGGESWHEF